MHKKLGKYYEKLLVSLLFKLATSYHFVYHSPDKNTTKPPTAHQPFLWSIELPSLASKTLKSERICFRWGDWNNFQQSFRAHIYPPCGIVLKDPNCCYTPWAIDDSGFKIRRGLSTNYKFTCEFRLVEFRPFHWLRKSLFQILLFATPQQETKKYSSL